MQDVFNKASGEIDQMLSPARKVQEVMVDHMARMVDFQVSCMRGYSDLCLEQLKSMQSVQSPEDMQAFLNQHTDMIKAASEKMSSDMGRMVSLQREFGEDLQKVTQESMSGIMQQPVRKAAAKASTAKKS